MKILTRLLFVFVLFFGATSCGVVEKIQPTGDAFIAQQDSINGVLFIDSVARATIDHQVGLMPQDYKEPVSLGLLITWWALLSCVVVVMAASIIFIILNLKKYKT